MNTSLLSNSLEISKQECLNIRYKKYDLTKDEIEFIESMIKPMNGNINEIIEEG
jgi:uncharacterized protein YpmS